MRWRRSCWRDGAVDGERWWPGEPTPAKRDAGGGGGERARALRLWGARRGRAGEGERVEWRGPPGCHPYAVAGVRRPRGGRGLMPVGRGACAGGRASVEAGRAGFDRGPRSEGATH